MALKQIRISEILEHLHNGYTRYEKDAVEAGMSIETKFGLSKRESSLLFAHDKIKRVKTIFPTILIIDDTEQPALSEPALHVVDDTPPSTAPQGDLQATLDQIVSPNTVASVPAPEPVAELELAPVIDPFA